MNASRSIIRKDMTQTCHFIIDGMPCKTIGSVVRMAREKGYTGSSGLIAHRLRKGACTWAEICKNPATDGTGKVRAARKRAQDECAALMADMDARKAAMKEAA